MKRKICVLLTLALVVSLALTGCGGGNTKPAVDEYIKIGSVMPITGPIATFGLSSVDAINLAFEEINAAGGVLGKQLKLYNEDNQSKGDETGTAFTKLINSTGVVAIIGSVASGHSMVGAPIAEEAGIPMLSPTSTNPAVTLMGDYIFRACFLDTFQGSAMAEFAYVDLGAKTAAMIVQSDEEYAVGLAQYFAEAFTAFGGQIVAEEFFMGTDIDFSAVLTNVKAANPDVIYIPSYYDTVGPILKQAKAADLDAVFLGGDGWDSEKLFELAEGAEEGGYFTNHYSPGAATPEVEKFLASYQEKYNKIPDALAALAYDSAYILAQAIREAGSTDGAAIREALANITFTGVSGTITFDENGDPVKPLWINVVTNGTFDVAKIVDP